MITVRFVYLTGIRTRVFGDARLVGSWDGWTPTPMVEIVADDGCPAFTATVQLDDALAGQTVRWGVRLDAPGGDDIWGINLEVPVAASTERHRQLRLPAAGGAHEERYHFTYSRRLGAQKAFAATAPTPRLRFAVWAPNATAVDVVFSPGDRGYVADDGSGIDSALPVIALHPGPGGIWESAPVDDFAAFVGLPYMFRIDTGGFPPAPVYRTDIHSRWQIGRGNVDPARRPWDGAIGTLDGTVSCSVVIDQDVVRQDFEPSAGSPPRQLSDDDFWLDEHRPGSPVPTRIEDLVIYELHVGSLGFPSTDPGTLADAMGLVDHLSDLGVNAVELLPISEFSGNLGWGYGDTHLFVIESSAGGRDKYKHFVRECHRRGIAVIQDVVYNHFDSNAARAEWEYDSTAPEENIYYWYEGNSAEYPHPDGGYLNNGSTGYTPRFWEETVRQLFISSAAEFVAGFHVDGLRVDLTQAIHRDNSLNADNRGVGIANQFGQKLLREWSRTLRMIKPSVFLIAEDHTGWPPVLESADQGGLGFDSSWYAAFYHHLIGDASGGVAGLIREAGFGDDRALPMGEFAGRLWASAGRTVVYHESHDEAGNARGSMRTAKAAVNDAPLVGATRAVAEARCRVAAGLNLLSAGTPMFFMGEEIVAQKPYRFDNVATSKEDLLGERAGAGAGMFRFYQDLIALTLRTPAARSRLVDVVHALDQTRVVAFTRRAEAVDGAPLLVVASLNNHPFDRGYVVQTGADRLRPGTWREVFNSDSSRYGGDDVGNFGAGLRSDGGGIDVRLPANGFVVLQRVA